MLTDKLFTGQRQIAELGMYHYGARFYSPKLGRFLSADTIVPGYDNPQNLNRYSYVINNPLRYTDPTGHMYSAGEVGGGFTSYVYTGPTNDNDNNNNNDDEENDSGSGGEPNNEELIENLNEWAIATQDAATYVDAAFVYIEFGLVAGFCIATIEAGCVEGALGGLLLGQAMFNLSGANALETGLSFVSLVLTVAADGLDDGQFGEASLMSAVTFGVGTLMTDPIADFMIDGYASGYNHEIFNGIGTIFNGGSFLSDSLLDLITP
jgi:RHS repeat-associated protein